MDRRLGEIETALAAFEDRPIVYDPAEIARAGASSASTATANRGSSAANIRPEDEPPVDPPGELHEALFELQFARGLAAILSQGERLAQVGKLDIQVVFSIRRDSFLTRHL